MLGGAEDKLIGFARQYRKDYLADMRFGVVCTTWKASGDKLVPDQEERVYFADGSAPAEQDVWCDRQLARCPDGGSVKVRLAVEKAGRSWVREVSVPNLTQPQLQQVGIRLCGDTLHARVLLRSGGQTTESQPVSLVEDRS